MRIVRSTGVALGLCLLSGASSSVDSAGLSGKYAVRQIEFALDLRPPGSRLRLTLATGQSLDVTLEDRESGDRVLAMMGAVAQGARLAARIEEGEVRSLFLAVPEHYR